MILSLRRRHRRIFAILGLALPVAFAVGVAARRPVPVAASLPDGVVTSEQTLPFTEWRRAGLFDAAPVTVELMRANSGENRFGLRFHLDEDFVKPDLIVYWVAGSPGRIDTLPNDALLLGAFSASVLLLPEEATTGDGVLVLYSLADNEVVEVSTPIRCNVSSP